jgi:hypothetical protein
MAKIKVRKKPIVIEVEQFFYSGPRINGVFYPDVHDVFFTGSATTYMGYAYVVTAHGDKIFLEDGDWIFPEPDGEHFYPVRPDIFEATYQRVD